MNFGDIISGLIVAGVGILLLAAALSLPDAVGQDYGPGFFPSLIGAGLLVAGGWLMLRSMVSRVVATAPEPGQGNSGWAGVTLIVGLLLAYVFLAKDLGFHLSALLCVTPILVYFTRRILLSIVLSLVAVFGIHFLFYDFLRVPLPWGILPPFI